VNKNVILVKSYCTQLIYFNNLIKVAFVSFLFNFFIFI